MAKQTVTLHMYESTSHGRMVSAKCSSMTSVEMTLA